MASATRRRGFSAAEGFLALFFVASVFGYVHSQEWSGAWLLWFPALAAMALTLDDVGEGLRRRGERDAWILVALAGLIGLGWTLYAMLDETRMAFLRGVIGSGLVLLGAAFFAGQRVWRPERGLIPTGLAALVVAGLDPFARMTLPTVGAAIGLVGWLALERPTRRRPGFEASRRWPPLLAFASVAMAVALALGVLLPWAQPFVESAAARALPGSGEGQVGLSSTAELGALEKLALSREVVLRLWSDRPLKLRAHVLTEFDGRRWTAPRAASMPLPRVTMAPGGALGADLEALAGATFGAVDEVPSAAAWAQVLVGNLARGQLVAPPGPRLVRIAGGTPAMSPEGILSAAFWPSPKLYGVVYAPPGLASLTTEQRAAALQLPDALDPRLLELAERISTSARSDRERLESTLGWIGHECRYSLNAGAFRSDQPVAEFLFEKKRGYCEYFASGAALLLRLQGVPTRYVSGFSVRDSNRRGDHYLVRASDSHAWIETWMEGVGWVEADPTPAAQYDALHGGSRDGWLARAWEALSAFLAELSARSSLDWGDALRFVGRELAAAGEWLARRADVLITLSLVTATVLWARRFARRRRRRAPTIRAEAALPSVGPELGALMKDLERRWSELGHPRPPHRAPLEHLSALPSEVMPAPLLSTSLDTVDCYYRARFGGRSPDREELQRLLRAVKESAISKPLHLEPR